MSAWVAPKRPLPGWKGSVGKSRGGLEGEAVFWASKLLPSSVQGGSLAAGGTCVKAGLYKEKVVMVKRKE